MDDLNCCICDGEIDKQYTPEGKVLWDGGHNPDPVQSEGRCCTHCNECVVIPARMMRAIRRIGDNRAAMARKIARVSKRLKILRQERGGLAGMKAKMKDDQKPD